FFVLLFRCTPCSTFFPYTTLFRSVSSGASGVSSRCLSSIDRLIVGIVGLTRTICTHTIAASHHAGLANLFASLLLIVLRTVGKGDRKSTRLNSSHVSISYAVFCLK